MLKVLVTYVMIQKLKLIYSFSIREMIYDAFLDMTNLNKVFFSLEWVFQILC